MEGGDGPAAGQQDVPSDAPEREAARVKAPVLCMLGLLRATSHRRPLAVLRGVPSPHRGPVWLQVGSTARRLLRGGASVLRPRLSPCLCPRPGAADCPGTSSDEAGKASACAGCPNQSVCATAPKGPDPGALSCPLSLGLRAVCLLASGVCTWGAPTRGGGGSSGWGMGGRGGGDQGWRAGLMNWEKVPESGTTLRSTPGSGPPRLPFRRTMFHWSCRHLTCLAMAGPTCRHGHYRSAHVPHQAQGAGAQRQGERATPPPSPGCAFAHRFPHPYRASSAVPASPVPAYVHLQSACATAHVHTTRRQGPPSLLVHKLAVARSTPGPPVVALAAPPTHPPAPPFASTRCTLCACACAGRRWQVYSVGPASLCPGPPGQRGEVQGPAQVLVSSTCPTPSHTHASRLLARSRTCTAAV